MRLIEKIKQKPLPKHVALILDGNGRWAKKRGLKRQEGHKHGALNVKNTALLANELGIEVISLYAFSTENWSRPKHEVDYLMQLPKIFEEDFQEDFKKYDIRVIFSGRRDRLSSDNRALLSRVEENTQDRDGTIVNVCLDYGSKDEITRSVKAIAQAVKDKTLPVDEIDELTIENHLDTKGLPPVDLLVRTSGELRLSNFLLWQVAYAEFYFTKVTWPAFKKRPFLKAIKAFQKRHRKFGGLKGR